MSDVPVGDASSGSDDEEPEDHGPRCGCEGCHALAFERAEENADAAAKDARRGKV